MKESNNDNVVCFDDLKKKKIKSEHIIKKAEPLTENIGNVIKQFEQGKNLLLNGCAGTGKTFVLLNKCLQTVLESNEYHQIVIVRSAVAVRDMGFLKGSDEEKMAVYESPYRQICGESFGVENGDQIYDKLKSDGHIKFCSTSFNQGITFHNSLVIVDESQNLNYAELSNIITRVGNNTRIFFTGDFKKQNMLTKSSKDTSGYSKLINVINSDSDLRNEFGIITMTEDDVVRSGFVKKFIIADNNYKD